MKLHTLRIIVTAMAAITALPIFSNDQEAGIDCLIRGCSTIGSGVIAIGSACCYGIGNTAAFIGNGLHLIGEYPKTTLAIGGVSLASYCAYQRGPGIARDLNLPQEGSLYALTGMVGLVVGLTVGSIIEQQCHAAGVVT